MDDNFELFDASNAQAFLRTFPDAVRSKGLACFNSNRVLNLVAEEPGRAYAASVLGPPMVRVRLHCEPESGWEGTCTCPARGDCEHVYAVVCAVLAEQRTAVVRGLSAGGRPPQLLPGGPQPKLAEPANPNDLKGLLTVALCRRLKPGESRFVDKVQAAYLRSRLSHQISAWDFAEMDLPFRQSGHDWSPLEIWPSHPANLHEFWLYVAQAAQERGAVIPDFMQPVTDLRPILERLARWRRSREIQKWKHLLDQVHPPPASGVASPGEFDLRLVLEPGTARLDVRRPGAPGFEPLRRAILNRLHDAHYRGVLQLAPGADLLWHLLADDIYAESGLGLGYGDENASLWRRLLSLPQLESRIVTEDAQPLERRADPLRWELTPAADENDDYRLRLVDAQGAPAPPLVCALPGRPALYLAARALFKGPDLVAELLDLGTDREARIPAPALETGAGVALLRTLGLDLPARVRERVQSVPLSVTIVCSLRQLYPGSPSEECHFQIEAAAPDGHKEAFDGKQWNQSSPVRAAKRSQQAAIVVYDRTLLGRFPALLDPLNPKINAYTGYISVRVTRRFGEDFAAWLRTVPPDIPVRLEGELASFAADAVAGRVKLDVSEVEIDWFDLRVVLDVSDTSLTAEEIKLLLNAKGRFVRLAGKGWRCLRFDLSQEEDERLARLGLNPRELSAEPQRLHALQLADEAARKFLPPQQVEQIQRRAADLKARVTPPLPERVTAELRPYQIEGFHFLAYLAANRFGGILADDMGLGKTLQTLAWLVWLRDQPASAVGVPPKESGAGGVSPKGARGLDVSPKLQLPDPNPLAASPPSPGSGPADQRPPSPPLPRGEGRAEGEATLASPSAAEPTAGAQPPVRSAPPPSLVVCPKSVMDNWHAEAARFTPGLRVKVWPAAELGGLKSRLDEADLHVINYSQLRSLGEPLAPVSWLAVILDEGQYIKNPNSQTAQVARALRARHRLVLSGTPIENRLLDLWSLMAFTMPGLLGNRAQFARLYDPKGEKPDPLARRRLASRVRPFLLRRTKGQVAKDLPDRVEEDLFCEIEGEQKTLYRAELKRAQQSLLVIQTQQELAAQQFNFLVSLLRLRQVCCHPRLHSPNSSAASAKTDALLEQLEPLMEEGHKALVFSQFATMLDLLLPSIRARNWPVFHLAGDTENRGELVHRFQTTDGPAVFLISLKAGGFGLNLTAASYVFLFDPWWNPAVENQAIDRTHRIGQLNKVIAYRLLIKDSIEEKIRLLQKQKKALAEDVLGEERFAQSLTLEDLRFLFAE